MTETIPTPQERDDALKFVTQTENGEIPLDIAKYRIATEVLAKSDLEDEYLKFPPRLTSKISEAINIARKIFRSAYGVGKKKNNLFASEIMKLNRKLSHFAKDEDWAEEMNIAGIFMICRNHGLIHTRKFFENLDHALFAPESVNRISLFIFGPPNIDAIYITKYRGIHPWKLGVLAFLEEIAKAPAPSIIIFCAMQIDVMYAIKHDLKKNNPRAWKHMRHLSKKSQLWYHGKIVETIGSVSKDEYVHEILRDYQKVSMKIFTLLEDKPEALAEVEG